MPFKTILFFHLFLISGQALAFGSVGLLYGAGSFSVNNFPVSSYGLSLSGRKEKPAGEPAGEIALSYLSQSVGHPSAQVTLNSYAIDLRRRFTGQFGAFLGMDVVYFSSGNENLISSGLGVAPQLGYDLGLSPHVSLGVQGQWFFGRSFPQIFASFKLSN